jgi:hypothetical protein
MEKSISMKDVMDFLYEHRSNGLPPHGLAAVFDQLFWTMEDNGDALCRVAEDWMRGDDENRVAIVLAMDSVYPFHGGAQMISELDRIAVRWPALAQRCSEIVERWKLEAHS